MMWKLLISGFHLTFDNRALSGRENVEWKQAEVKTTSHCHCDIMNCERCRVEDVVALPSVSCLDFFTCEKLAWSISRNSLIQCKASFRVSSTFLAIPNARLKTFFLTRSVANFLKHESSNVRRKPEINQSFHIVSYLWFILLCCQDCPVCLLLTAFQIKGFWREWG